MKKILTLSFIWLISTSVSAQITGLWEVVRVSVGEQEMTPISKWSDFNEEGTFVSGNGWLQNSNGEWNFDASSSEVLMTIKTGFYDPYGPFKVSFEENERMIWVREEEGEEVIVYYSRIETIRKGLQDLATGIWDLTSASRNGEDVLTEFDPGGTRFVHLRWDQLINDFTSKGRVSGIWRIDAHRPVLDIVYYDTSKASDYWEVSFKGEDEMIWIKKDLKIIFSRLNSFPQ